jgi:cell division septation protein DedD
MKHLVVWQCLILVLGASGSVAQGQEPNIQPYLDQISAGRSADVRPELPGLLSKYPNNPSVLYVQGLLTTEGAEAVRVFQSIVDNFPQSEWADDALHRVYQFYYALGLYRTAELKLSQLRRDYPSSPHLNVSAGGDVASLPEEREDTTSAPPPADTPASVSPAAPTVIDSISPAPAPAPPPSREDFQLQAGAFTALANAERQKALLEGLGYAVEIRVKVAENRSLYTVLAGNYRTADEARAAASSLKRAHGVDAIVVRP